MSDVVVPLLPDRAGAHERPRLSTYIVTGCAGFIGSHLAETLLRRGDAVIGIDALTDYYAAALKHANLEHLLARRGFIFLKSDLVDAPLDALLPGVDGVFHLAAQPGVRGSWGQSFDIYVRDNLLATQRVMEAATDAEVRVVFASSSSVYGDAPSYPTIEDSPLRPVSPYGVTKLCCEHLAHVYATFRGLDAVALRYFTVYGPRQRPDMAVQRIARAVVDGRRFRLYGSGEQSRDVTYVDDAVTAAIAAMEAAPAGAIYNVGGGGETSLRRIIELCEQLGAGAVEIESDAAAAGDVKRTSADTSRIRADLGWSPQTPLEDGLISQLAWTMSQRAWAEPAVYAG
jgi:nucleoside-diphosphate-sugar epimerase